MTTTMLFCYYRTALPEIPFGFGRHRAWWCFFCWFSLLFGSALQAQEAGRVISWGALNSGCGTDVVAISAGYGYGLSLNRDGTVTACGTYSPFGGPVIVPPGLTNVVAVSAGMFHSLALKDDGTVVAWGAEARGTNVPPNLTNVVAISAGGGNLALRQDGSVLAWGGWGTNLPLGLTNVVAIAAGSGNLALKADGTIAIWGAWEGPAGTTNSSSGLADVVAISAGYNEWLALRADGTLTGAGWFSLPPGLSDIQTIAASSGSDHHMSMALAHDGTLVAWGYDFYGGPNPAVFPGLTNVVALAAGGTGNLGLIGGGRPFLTSPIVNRVAVIGGTTYFRIEATGAWPLSYQWEFKGTPIPGATNSTLALSDVRTDQAGNYAVKVSNPLGDIVSKPAVLEVFPILIAAPPQAAITFIGGTAQLSVDARGSGPLSFSWHHDGKLIEGATNAVLDLENVQASEAGLYSVVVSNSFGTAASPAALLTVAPILIPVQPRDQITFIGGPASFEVLAEGKPPLGYSWVLNGEILPGATNATLTLTNLQLADRGFCRVIVSNVFGAAASIDARVSVLPIATWGVPEQNKMPHDLTDPIAIVTAGPRPFARKQDGTWVTWGGGPEIPTELTNAIALAGGREFSVALREDGAVVAWGPEQNGETHVPSDLTNAVAIAAQYGHALALKFDGTVVAWGDNYNGSGAVPVGLSNVVSIAAGAYHNVALKSDGSVVAWGDNSHFGQTNLPAGIQDAVAVAAGWWHSLVLRADGTVLGWGLDIYGQATSPPGLSNVVAIACGSAHSVALKADGSVVAWGYGEVYEPNDSEYGQAIVPPALANVTAIAVGDYISLALQGDGPPVQQVSPTDTNWDGERFTLSVPTQVGRVYRLEYTESLQNIQWTALPLVAGNGGVRTLVDTTADGRQRFYRVRRW